MDVWTVLGIVFVVVVVSAGWFLVTKLLGAAHRRADAARSLKQLKAGLPAHHVPRWSAPRESFAHADDAAALAASAPFSLCWQAPYDVFALGSQEDARGVLDRDWGVRDAPNLRRQQYALLVDGHRRDFDAERATWIEADAARLAEMRRYQRRAMRADPDAHERLVRLDNVAKDARGIRGLDFLAWDLVRVILLARAGAGAGYLPLDEARDTANLAAAGLREAYGSWSEVGEAFLRARWYWASVDGDALREHDAHDEHRLSVLNGADSPWAAVPWTAPIPRSEYLLLEELADLGRLNPLDPDADRTAPTWRREVARAVRESSAD